MELLEGESLGTRLRRVGALAIPTAVEFAYQTASALGAAHKKGIVHRDLKPDNLFVVPDIRTSRSGERIKVLDFGIAKLQQGSTGDSVKTRTGTLDGYAGLHVARAVPRDDARSTTAATSIRWASSSSRCWSAQPPFVSEGFGELVNMHLNVAAPAPSRAAGGRPAGHRRHRGPDAVQNPDDRFADMAQVQVALKASGGTQFVVRGARRRRPSWAAAPAPSGPIAATGRGTAPSSPKLHDTTFSTGVGERVGPTTAAPRKRGRRAHRAGRRGGRGGGGRLHFPRRREGWRAARRGAGFEGRAAVSRGGRQGGRGPGGGAPGGGGRGSCAPRRSPFDWNPITGATVVDDVAGGVLGEDAAGARRGRAAARSRSGLE